MDSFERTLSESHESTVDVSWLEINSRGIFLKLESTNSRFAHTLCCKLKFFSLRKEFSLRFSRSASDVEHSYENHQTSGRGFLFFYSSDDFLHIALKTAVHA